MTVFVMRHYLCEQFEEDEPALIRNVTVLYYYNIKTWALINESTFEEGRLFKRGCLLDGGR